MSPSSAALLIRVDVIIAVHNAESTIAETVDSAMRQVVPDHLLGRRQLLSREIDATSAVHFDVCVCCYDDASTDESLEALHSLDKERTWEKTGGGKGDDVTCAIKTRLLIGAAPDGTKSRGAGYARNRAARLRDARESSGAGRSGADEDANGARRHHHFFCILDSDDVMHPTRIAEQTYAMLSLDENERERTLMGCQFDRIPKGSTSHYTEWANTLSNERLYLEQFRECTLVSHLVSSSTVVV